MASTIHIPEIFTVAGATVGVIPIAAGPEGRRRAETEAVAALLAAVAGPGARIEHDAAGAPLLAGAEGYVSVSHSPDAAALVFDRHRRVGVDIEACARARQLARVAPRVLSCEELAAYGGSDEGLLRAWTLKEALYKVAGEPGVDWRTGLGLPLPINDTHARAGAHACEILYSCLHGADRLTVVRRVSP